MRLLAMACALVIVTCVAVFGAVLSQKPNVSVAAPAPLAEERAAGAVITTLDEQDTPAPSTITTGKSSSASIAQEPVLPTPAVAPAAPTANAAPPILLAQ